MMLLGKRGQQIGEYAVLLGIVLGAVVAVQAVIRNQIAKGIKGRADVYYTEATNGLSNLTAPDQTSVSASKSFSNMSNIASGTSQQLGKSETYTPN